MKINVVQSGSDGNCYFVSDSQNNSVILDCGLPFQQITNNSNFPKFSKIDFVFVSHLHNDHNKSMKEFELAGCEMLTYEILKPKVQKWDIGEFECITFPISHNVPNWGIVIKSKIDNEKLCYMTDFNKAPKIEGCDTYLFEINYIGAYIDEMIEEDKEIKNNGFVNHCSLEYAIEYFSSLNTKVKEIIVCHTSKSNAIKSRILNAMQPFADKVTMAENWRE